MLVTIGASRDNRVAKHVLTSLIQQCGSYALLNGNVASIFHMKTRTIHELYLIKGTS